MQSKFPLQLSPSNPLRVGIGDFEVEIGGQGWWRDVRMNKTSSAVTFTGTMEAVGTVAEKGDGKRRNSTTNNEVMT